MGIRKILKKLVSVFSIALCSLLLMGSIEAQASVQQLKLYKEAFPGTKPKCLFCHTDKVPKKEVGKHDLSAYGLKAKETDSEITAETYKKIGSVEDFEKNNQEKAIVENDNIKEGEKTACDEKDKECVAHDIEKE